MVLATLPLIPPAPVSDGAPADQFSADRAMSHVEMIAREPHPMGSDEIEDVREYIVSQMAGFGLEIDQQTFTAPDYFGTPGNTVEGVNVLAKLAGTDPSEALLFVAHHDTVPATPGANDNSTPVAALIESARALSSGEPLADDIIFLFTDTEEPQPRPGVKTFTSSHPWFGDVGLVVNLEAAGGKGPALLTEVSGNESAIVRAFTDASSHPVVFSFATEITALIGEIGTDFDEFRRLETPGLAFAYLHDASIYHTERDSIEAVSRASLQHHGEHVMGIARLLGVIDSPSSEGGANYLTVGPNLTVIYSDGWGMVLALAALVLLAWTLGRSRRVGEGLKGFGLAVLGFLGALIVGALAWWAIGSTRSTMSTVEGYVYFGALVMLVAFGAAALMKRSRTLLLPGIAVFWTLLGTALAFFAPGLGYVFIWTAIAGTILLLAPNSILVRVGVVLAVAVVHVPWIDFLLQFSMPRPGNPDSQLLPLGGAAIAFAALSLLVVKEAVGAYERTR
jgi:hypothetical protein